MPIVRKDERRRSLLPPRGRKRKPRGVVDTSVLVGGISGFRKPHVRGRNPSADLLYRWAEKGNFVWLVTEDILDEYKEVLKRLGVRPSLIGTVINLIRGGPNRFMFTHPSKYPLIRKMIRFAFVPKRATPISSSR